MNKQQTYKRRLVDAQVDEILQQLPALLVVGARASGKTTTFDRRATTTIRLDIEAEAAAFEADPDAALHGLTEPVLLDEWQRVPGVLGAARRAVEADPRPNRFYVTGSVRADLQNEVWPATGRLVRVAIYPMTVREQVGRVDEPSFFDKLADGQVLAVPEDSPDIRGYIALALQSGFPFAALQLSGRARQEWLESYIDDLLTRDVEQLEQKKRDRERLRRYFETYALNSAGVTDHKSIYEKAGISKATAAAYEDLLTGLLIVEEVPAWTSNRLKRLQKQPKRYLIDAALIGGALRMNEQGVLSDGDMLGRVLDTFVAAQLRPELRVSESRPRLYHLRREQGEHEVDLLAELGGERLIGLEIKATAAPKRSDAKHLIWLREELTDRFIAGVVFHTGPRLFSLDDKIVAAPISVLWG